MIRRGLTLRILLAVALALTAVVATIFGGLYWVQRSEFARGFPIPLPRQVAAIVEMIESTPPETLPTLLNAFNSTGLLVSVETQAPEIYRAEALPRMRRALEIYLNELGGRSVEVFVEADEPDIAPAVIVEEDRMRATRPIRIVVSLRDGRFVVVEAYGEIFGRLTGVRLAIAILIVVIVVGAATLWAVRRQVGPVERLAEAVEGIAAPNFELPGFPDSGPREVRHLILAMERMHRRIQDLMTARTRMLAAIGHDFGTYLTRLRLRAEFIADEVHREKAICDIEDMHALMTDTLTLARLEEDEAAEPVNLTELISRLVDSAASAGEAVTMSAEGALWIEGHAVAIARAVHNVIGNAVKFGTQVEVTVSRIESMVEVRVDDRGPGIPPEERDAVLEPFYRTDKTRNLDNGSFGLGLAIVADIVRRHGGEVDISDRPGGGLRVSIRLPALTWKDTQAGLDASDEIGSR